MSILSVFCPVKVFGYLVKGEHRSSVASIVGSAIAATSFPASVLLLRFGHKEWVKPTVILGLVGTATAVLGLENKRVCAVKKPEPQPDENDVIKAVEYLATYYWRFWEQKINNESEILKERLVRPNIPSEFAYAFGYALLKVLESKIDATYERVCVREGDVHPEAWEFRSEIRELEMQEKELWAKTRAIIDDYRSGKKAFSKYGDDNMSRPLIYCALLGVLRSFHPKYKKILLESRAKKLETISQQMKEPAIKLPTIPETFQEKVPSRRASPVQILEASGGAAASEVEAAPVEMRSPSFASLVSSDEPPMVSRYEYLCLDEEPKLSPRK